MVKGAGFGKLFFFFLLVLLLAFSVSSSDISLENSTDLTSIINETVNNTSVNETQINDSVVNKSLINVTEQPQINVGNDILVNESQEVHNETVSDAVVEQAVVTNRYIIEFKKDPLLKKFKREVSKEKQSLDNQAVSGFSIRTFAVKDLNKQIEDYQDELELEHSLVLSEIDKILEEDTNNSKVSIGETTATTLTSIVSMLTVIFFKLTGFAVADASSIQPEFEFYNVFNGIVLELDETKAEKINNSKFVKGVYPDLEVNIVLMDSVPLINADDAWKLDSAGAKCNETGEECLTGRGISIAIIDTGVDYKHEDLGGCFGSNCKVVGGYDTINNDNDPSDDHGHGTHVAAIAAGKGKLNGVAPDAKILSYKVLSAGGSGSFASVIAGVERAVDPNNDGDFSDSADIISMSLGASCWSYSSSCGPDDPLSRSVDNAVDAGVIAVIAAGNSGAGKDKVSSPGTARKAITVAATDKSDVLAWFSSRGPVIWNGEDLKKPDIAAPGVNICAAQWDNAWSYSRCLDNKHVAISGTSMATPHVAGASALVNQKNPSWSPGQVKEALKGSAVSLNYKYDEIGSGRLEVLGALGFEAPPQCTIDSNCTDNLFCNGNETCINGRCKNGTPPSLDDGISCTADVCDESADRIVHAPDNSLCSNNLYCDGIEVCDLFVGCVSGAAPACDDSLDCTNSYCDESVDNCVHAKIDNDNDGYGICEGAEFDCDDLNFNINPGAEELCNGMDDNCDDEIDNNLVPPDCEKNLGVCAGSVKRCDGSIGWVQCMDSDYGGDYEAVELSCFDNLDNDCDGKVDADDLVDCPDSDGDGILDQKDRCPNTPTHLKNIVNKKGCPKPKHSKFDIILDLDDEDLLNIIGFEIGKTSLGKILFSDSVSLVRRDGGFYDGIDLDSYIDITRRRIEIDSDKLPELNKPAIITMYDVNLNNPVVLRDGQVCSECTIIFFDNERGIVQFSVPHFTAYELAEGEEEQTGGGGGGGGGGGASTSTTISTFSGSTTYNVRDTVDDAGDNFVVNVDCVSSSCSINIKETLNTDQLQQYYDNSKYEWLTGLYISQCVGNVGSLSFNFNIDLTKVNAGCDDLLLYAVHDDGREEEIDLDSCLRSGNFLNLEAQVNGCSYLLVLQEREQVQPVREEVAEEANITENITEAVRPNVSIEEEIEKIKPSKRGAYLIVLFLVFVTAVAYLVFGGKKKHGGGKKKHR